jgi:hypothetical protein
MLMMICVQLPTYPKGGLRQYYNEIKSHAIDVCHISDVDLTLETHKTGRQCK